MPEPEDRYQRYLNEDFASVVAELMPLAEAEGIRADIAERVLRAEFTVR